MPDVAIHLPPVDPRPLVHGQVDPAAPWEQRIAYALAGLGCSPSVHNTQPWSVRLVHERRLTIWADETRWLRHLDPRRRQLSLSLGCAMHGLNVAARAAGIRLVVSTLPEGARGPAFDVWLHHGPEATEQDVLAAAALASRRTVRGALSADEVGLSARQSLLDALDGHRASMFLVAPGSQMEQLGRLTALATWEQGQDKALADEIERWTRGELPATDGVPDTTWVAASSFTDPLPHRDFSLGREPAAGWSPQPEVAPPLAAIICAEHDEGRSWLDAGQALHSVLIAAWLRGLVGCPVDAAIEVTHTNHELRRAFSIAGAPQVVLRLGHALPELPGHTPRRLVSDLTTAGARSI